MTPKTDSSDNKQQHKEVIRGRRVEDELRLRELELQTNFQIKTLTESLNLLKTEFHSWRDSLNEKLDKVNQQVDNTKSRLTLVIALLVGQFGLAAAPTLMTKIALGG